MSAVYTATTTPSLSTYSVPLARLASKPGWKTPPPTEDAVSANNYDDAPYDAVEQEDIPPDGGYGWVVCLCVFLINAHTWGVNSAWGVFLAFYLSNSTFPNATHLEYALIGGLSISQSLMISPLIATSNRHLGTRLTLLIGTVLVFASLLTASFATQIWHLFLSQGLLFGWGMGFLYVTATSILPQWFLSRRSLAVGLATSGAGLGGLTYNLVTGAAITHLGPAWTYRILAIAALTANLLSTFLLRDRNKSVQPTHVPLAYKEYARVEVLLVITWGVLTELGYITLLYSLPSYALSISLTAKQGSIVAALLNLGLAIGRPLVGYTSDIFGRLNIAVLTTFISGALCLGVWVPATSYAPLLVFALLVGTVAGTFWSTVAPVTAELVGLKRLPSAFGVVVFSLVLPTTFAEPIALQLVKTTTATTETTTSAKGSERAYLTSQVFVGCMFLAATAATTLLRSWKVCEIKHKKEVEDHGMRGAAARGGGERPKKFLAGGVAWLNPKNIFYIGRV